MFRRPIQSTLEKLSIIDRSLLEKVLGQWVTSSNVDVEGAVLIVGGGSEDARILRSFGFHRITLSNLRDFTSDELAQLEREGLKTVTADVEDIVIPDNSYDLVFTHAVVHHCRSPHKALLEMLRVSRKHVIIMEPNESLLVRALVKLRFSFPYELPAVISNKFESGGVRNSCVPNYIYRWGARDLYQAAASYLPERGFDLYVRQYWDFNIDSEDLARRSETRIGSLTKMIGPDLFLAGLRGFQAVVNHLPWLVSQGNKFFGCITKQEELKPWLQRDGDRIVFNRKYPQR